PLAVPVGLDLLLVVNCEEREARAADRTLAAVPDLAPRLRVERRFVEHDDARLAARERGHRRAVLVERRHAARVRQRFVAAKRRLASAVVELRAGLELARRARTLALRTHRFLEPCLVDGDAAFTADVGR